MSVGMFLQLTFRIVVRRRRRFGESYALFTLNDDLLAADAACSKFSGFQDMESYAVFNVTRIWDRHQSPPSDESRRDASRRNASSQLDRPIAHLMWPSTRR